MKITVTYQTSRQTGPYDYEAYTAVMHLDKSETLDQVLKKITRAWNCKNISDVDVQLHYSEAGKE